MLSADFISISQFVVNTNYYKIKIRVNECFPLISYFTLCIPSPASCRTSLIVNSSYNMTLDRVWGSFHCFMLLTTKNINQHSLERIIFLKPVTFFIFPQ